MNFNGIGGSGGGPGGGIGLSGSVLTFDGGAFTTEGGSGGGAAFG
jgi:hypothetical protein